MELTASYSFAHPAAAVWALLVDVDAVAACLPGCERLEPLGDDRYRAVLTLAVSAISGRYDATVALLDKQPPHSYRLVVAGTGRTGFVNGEAAISLVEQDGQTVVQVTGRADVGGTIASVGQRLLGTVSRTIMDRFFACLQRRLAG
jgi:carbon monoxide dehydrogenase subunit G